MRDSNETPRRLTSAGPATVSVAIATYNRAAMVREAIEAALRQTLPPQEIVVSDDASTDETRAVLGEIAARESMSSSQANPGSTRAPRLRVIRQASNSGGVENWNRAMEATRGKLLAWCSDDDRFLPDHLQASVEFLQAHSEIGIVHSSFVDCIQGAGGERPAGGATSKCAARRLRSSEPIVIDRTNWIRYMIRYYDWPFHPSTLVMRREVWERVGKFDARFALADTDWFVRAAQATKIAMLPRHGVINRRHAGNWSNRVGSAEMQREIFEIVDGAIGGRGWMERRLWRFLWRMNVRARLGLTVRARVRAGYEEAACAAWRGIFRNTGGRGPVWMERIGERAIRRMCGRRAAEVRAQEVSPL